MTQNLAKARACVAGLLKREPYATHIQLNDETIASVDMGDILASSGLFKDKIIVTLSQVFTSEHAESVSEYVKLFAESEHIVIVIEGELKAKEKNLLKKYAHTLVESVVKETKKVESYNPFALSDALYARDSKALFMRIEEARMRGDDIEATVGLLSWSAKAMRLAEKSESAATSGLKPFVHTKARAGARMWGASLPELVRSCAYLVHATRRDGRDGYDELTRVLLRLCA